MTAQSTEHPTRRRAATGDVKLYARQRIAELIHEGQAAQQRVSEAAAFGRAAGIAARARLSDAAELLAHVAGYRGEALRAFTEGVRAGAETIDAVTEYAAR